MFNKPRDTNFNPNDNPKHKRALARWAAWTLLIHPVGIIAACLTLYITVKLGLRARWVLCLPLTVIVVEAGLLRGHIGPRRLVTWSNAFRFRRDWFGIWTDTVTARTDHSTRMFSLAPLLGVIPKFGHDGMVSWNLRPPKGQTLEYYAQYLDVIAAHSWGVEQVHVRYPKSTSSKGVMQIVFTESLIAQKFNDMKEDIHELV